VIRAFDGSCAGECSPRGGIGITSYGDATSANPSRNALNDDRTLGSRLYNVGFVHIRRWGRWLMTYLEY
jgi:hypothetical protein